MRNPVRSITSSVTKWFDGSAIADEPRADGDRIDWVRCVPFVLLHVAVLGIIWVGFSWTALAVAVGLYFVRMFAVTAFYHRYFSHRSFKTSRWFQFIMGVAGSSAVQRGPIWWSAHHRHHHVHSDEHPDQHSPGLRGFLMSHMGWFMTHDGFTIDPKYVRDWMRFPELRLLDRLDWLVPLLLAVGLFAVGAVLERFAPALGTSGMQLVVWGFVCSTLAVYHATYTINSFAHSWGRQRYATGDDSRNNFWLALITLGEGWHNNHHHYPAAVRQGFYWWEVDVTYYVLRMLSWSGIIWDLRAVPKRVLAEGRQGGAAGRGAAATS